MDYTDLITISPINAYSKANDLTAELPRLVERAHKRVVQRIDHDLFETDLGSVPVATTGIGNLTGISAPVLARLMEFRSVFMDDGSGNRWALTPRDRGTLRMLYPNDPQAGPRYYETPGTAVRVWPRPYVAMTAHLWAAIEPEVPSGSVSTNIIMDKHPLTMEWATAMEVAVFMLDKDMIATFKAELDSALMEANLQIGRRRRDESAQRPIETRNVTGT
jgi:hypothetical protein